VLACAPLRPPARAAVVAGIAVLGLTAVADRALHIRWLWEGGAWALVLVPVAAWTVTSVVLRAAPAETRPGIDVPAG